MSGFRTTLCSAAIVAAAAVCLQAANPQPSVSPAPVAAPYRAVLNRYCVTCHNEKLKTAGLMLDKIDLDNVSAGAPTWEKVIRKLRTGAMPPTGMPRPDQASYNSFATYLETAIDQAAIAKPNPGRPAVHRLNRAEYSNAIRDLLALEIDGTTLLPADDAGEGFDNIADSLSVSPALMDRYMSAAKKIRRLAIGDPTIGESTEKYVVPKFLVQDDRVSQGLPFASRGGIAVRHHFPLDGEYFFKLRLRRDINGRIWGLQEGLAEPNQLEFRLDGVRVARFAIGGERKGQKRTVNNTHDHEEDPDILKYEAGMDAHLEGRFTAKAGTRLVSVFFVRPAEPEGVLRPEPLDDLSYFTGLYKFGAPDFESISIGGPYNAQGVGETPSREKVFTCRPDGSRGQKDEEQCATSILSGLARHAYRRPLDDGDVQRLLKLYKVGRGLGGFEAGIGAALEGMLVSPDFLFRTERDPAGAAPGSVYPVADLELASRLSFFLWSSLPDDELLDLAARGKLKNREVLDHQVDRMLRDSRAKALVTNFAGQWLMLRNMDKVVPDRKVFPDFDDNLRDAFRQETELFFESTLREDRSVLDLLNANYTYVNERLARFYQMPNVYGSGYRRVTVKDENRRGLLGQGSLLTVTSYATRTSPTIRGKWLLDNILGSPPPPPPPNVPSLKDRDSDGKILSVREQLEKHRANAVCASCHARMDPLGFALENFDGIGEWRTASGVTNTPVDSSGALLDGTKFQGPAELRNVLLSHPEQFATTVTEKLLTYSLGRGIGYYDAPAVRKIVRDSAPGNYRWSFIIKGIVRSTPFLMRRSRSS